MHAGAICSREGIKVALMAKIHVFDVQSERDMVMNCCSLEKGGSCCKFRKSKGIYKSHGSTGPAGHPCQGGRFVTLPVLH